MKHISCIINAFVAFNLAHTPIALGQLQPCLQGENPIQCENKQNGTSNWKLAPQQSNQTLEGFASMTSVDKNQSIDLFVNAIPGPANVKFEVFRMGWYGGLGARLVYDGTFPVPQQPPCPPDDANGGLIECHWADPQGNPTVRIYTSNFTRPPPLDGPVSGYYMVRLTTPPPPAAPTAQAYILFVVRDDERRATFLMNSAMTTYQAYNEWGGRSLYSTFSDGGFSATKVSLDRPMSYGLGVGDFMDLELTRYQNPNDPSYIWPGGFEYPMVRFLERQGYDVTYATDIDLHSNPNLLNNRDAFLSVGHDEYWSKNMHDNLETARDRSSQIGPLNISFFSGNSVYWITNVLPNTSQTAQYRIIETHKQANPPWLWQNCPQVQSGYPNAQQTCSANVASEQELVGSVTTDGATDRGDIVFSPNDLTRPELISLLKDTGLSATSRLAGMIGYESQTVRADLFPVPRNQTVFGQSTFKARPHGLSPETLRADMSLSQAISGASVISLGSPDWSLGLDIYTADPTIFPSSIYLRNHPAIPQLTRNILETVGRLPHVTPQPSIGPGYTVSLIPAVTCFNPNDPLTIRVSAPTGRDQQQCNDVNKPWCDAISIYNVLQNDDDNPASKTYIQARTDVPVNAPSVSGTYTADYVTVDRVWPSLYGDQLRTIWRATKSPRFCVPCPCVPTP